MVEQCPKVSIGLPVYNGEKYLREAIDSILAQTFTDFELIISDNASTDSTEIICKDYAAKDSRIRYYRNEKNIGSSNNFNRVFELSKGEYFNWLCHDDLISPTFLEKCVEVLSQNRDVVLCFSTFFLIDENSNQKGFNDQILGSSTKPYERFCELSSWIHDTEANFGLIRSDVLRKTQLEGNYSDSERILLTEIGLHGQFYIIPEPLFSRRYHQKRLGSSENGALEFTLHRFPELEGKARYVSFFTHWKQFLNYLRIISYSPIPIGERLRCYLYMVYWVSQYRRWETMIRELLAPIKKNFLYLKEIYFIK